MKNIVFLFISIFLFLSDVCHANEVITFKLSKGQKLIDTFSGDIDQNTSVHFIIFKDKSQKDYRIKFFFIDTNPLVLHGQCSLLIT
jgi:uncharacterized protein Veg